MAVLLSQMLFPGCQLDNLVLINKIKEQLMAEKIRPPHLPTASAPSQQPSLAPPSHADGSQHGMSKAQQMQVLHSHNTSQPDIALHARPASSSVTGTPHPQPSLFTDIILHLRVGSAFFNYHFGTLFLLCCIDSNVYLLLLLKIVLLISMVLNTWHVSEVCYRKLKEKK